MNDSRDVYPHPCGSMIVPDDDAMPYPRICAHRGLSGACPENTLPAFGSAIALGADEIEFDLWSTSDGELVSIHDDSLERVSNGSGKVYEHTLAELMRLDYGAKHSEAFRGLRAVMFEDILKKFACTVIMNIHVKIWDAEFENPMYKKIAELIRKYRCEKHVYMMSVSDKCLAEFHEIAPEIHRCVGFNGAIDKPVEIVERAIRLNCEKVQLCKPYFNQAAVDKAHKHGIKCNLFWANDRYEACFFDSMGIDTILTDNFIAVSESLGKHWKGENVFKW